MQWVFDTETYSNFHLFMAKSLQTGEVKWWECPNLTGLGEFMQDEANEFIGFNSMRYDLPLISYALTGASAAHIKQASDAIIQDDMQPWRFYQRFDCTPLEVNHIDLIEPAPGVGVSLKSYGARMHCPKLQDLPIEPDALLTGEQKEILRTYCINDLDTTAALYRSIEKQIDLRRGMSKQYGIDLRSKSDAQIAETIIKQEVGAATGREIKRPSVESGTTFRYQSPGFISFQTAELKRVHQSIKRAEFVVNDKGSIVMPDDVAALKIAIGESAYQLGIGGLHSTEKSVARFADDEHVLSDHDVASYYPSIILRCGLYPQHMGLAFIDIYQGFVTERLEAKKRAKELSVFTSDISRLSRRLQMRDKNALLKRLEVAKAELRKSQTVMDSFKTTINGSFGKFGSKWSVLYAPNLLIQVTLTGQLALLQLIEQLELSGIRVVSANTDGIVLLTPRQKIAERDAIIKLWEWFSGFETEATEYVALYSKDVNNYLAIKPNGEIKAKGLYADSGLTKNPTATVCVDAVKAHLSAGQSIESAIHNCTDLTKFIVVRAVRGGGVQGNNYLGKTVRWYWSSDHGRAAIHYKTTGNKVAKSEGSRAVMQLPETLPNDIDYQVYISEANEILKDIGATK